MIRNQDGVQRGSAMSLIYEGKVKSSSPATTDVKLGTSGRSYCGGDTSSYQGPYPTAACPEFHVSCRVGREIFTLLYSDSDAHGDMGCDKERFIILVVWR